MPPPPGAGAFSWRRFLVVLALLAAGVGIGVGLESYFRPPAPAAAPVQTVAAAPPPVPRRPAPFAAPSGLLGVEAAISFQNNLFPSLLLSFGQVSSEYVRNLTVRVSHARVGKPFSLRVDSSLFQQPLIYTATAAAETFALTPDLPWNYDALRQSTQLLPQSFVVAVSTPEGGSAQTTVTAMVHSVNEVVSRILNVETGEWQDTSVCYAAFVNEDHPWIGRLLQEALASEIVDRFTGYELGRNSVALQMEAIWVALAARGNNYVDLAATSGLVPGMATQYVRFLDQAVRDRGANCVDASALFASIFRRIGLRPVLLFKPGHCFVAVYDAAQGGHLIAVETTLLGSGSFASALAYGNRELEATLPHLDTQGYSTVDIIAARQAGVKPIEFQSQE